MAMRKSRKALIATLVVAAMMVAAPVVFAAKGDVRAATSDPDPGGEAYLLHTGKRLVLKACDIQRDGVSVFAYASYGKRYENETSDTDGANGNCETNRIRATRGRRVNVQVCLVDRDKENVLGFCSPWKKGRA
jgi:hypothetical protein